MPRRQINDSGDPKDNKSVAWNVLQATNYCLSVIKSDAPPSQKALAYSWLLHLIGDLHQPMHSVALFCERYPYGDRGGNSVKLAKGDSLHSLWDNLLGHSHKPNDVKREYVELKEQPYLWLRYFHPVLFDKMPHIFDVYWEIFTHRIGCIRFAFLSHQNGSSISKGSPISFMPPIVPNGNRHSAQSWVPKFTNSRESISAARSAPTKSQSSNARRRFHLEPYASSWSSEIVPRKKRNGQLVKLTDSLRNFKPAG